MKAAMRGMVANRITSNAKVVEEDDDESFFTPSPLLANLPYSQGGGIGDDVLVRSTSGEPAINYKSGSTLDLASGKMGSGLKDAGAQMSKVASAARAKLGPSLQQAGVQIGHKLGASLDASGKRMSAFVAARRERKMGSYPGSTKQQSPNLLNESTEYINVDYQVSGVVRSGNASPFRRPLKPHQAFDQDVLPTPNGAVSPTSGLYDTVGPSRYEPPTTSQAIVSRINTSFSGSQTSLTLHSSSSTSTPSALLDHQLPPRSNSVSSWYVPPPAPLRKGSGGPHNSAAYAPSEYHLPISPEPTTDYDLPAARYAAAADARHQHAQAATAATAAAAAASNSTPIASPVSAAADSVASHLPKSVSSARIAGPDRMLRRPTRVSVYAPTLPPFMTDELRNAEHQQQQQQEPMPNSGAQVAGNPLLGVLTGDVPLPPPSPSSDDPRNASQSTSSAVQTDESVGAESVSSRHSSARGAAGRASIANLLVSPRGASLDTPGNPLFAAPRNFSAATEAAAAAAASAPATTSASEAASESGAPSSASVAAAVQSNPHAHVLSAPFPVLLSADEEPNYDGPPPHSPSPGHDATTPEAYHTPLAGGIVEQDSVYDAPPASLSPAAGTSVERVAPPSPVGLSPGQARPPSLERSASSFTPSEAAAPVLSPPHSPSAHADADKPGPPPYVAPTGATPELCEKTALARAQAESSRAQSGQSSGRSLPPVPVSVPTGQAWAQDHAATAPSSATSSASLLLLLLPPPAVQQSAAATATTTTEEEAPQEAGEVSFGSIAAPARRTTGAPAPLGGPLFAGAAVGLAAASQSSATPSAMASATAGLTASKAPSSWRFSAVAPKLTLGTVETGFGERDAEWEWLSRGGKATPLGTPAPPVPLELPGDVLEEREPNSQPQQEASGAAPDQPQQEEPQDANKTQKGLSFDRYESDLESSPFAQSNEAVAMESDMAALLAAMEHAQHLLRHTNTPKPPEETAQGMYDSAKALSAEKHRTRRLLPPTPSA